VGVLTVAVFVASRLWLDPAGPPLLGGRWAPGEGVERLAPDELAAAYQRLHERHVRRPAQREERA
jgi:hypothetical protein